MSKHLKHDRNKLYVRAWIRSKNISTTNHYEDLCLCGKQHLSAPNLIHTVLGSYSRYLFLLWFEYQHPDNGFLQIFPRCCEEIVFITIELLLYLRQTNVTHYQSSFKKKYRVDNWKETHYCMLFEASNTILIG